LLLGYQDKRRELISHRLLGIACALVTFLILIWAVLTAVIYRLS
jgi:hypothetical protein